MRPRSTAHHDVDLLGGRLWLGDATALRFRARGIGIAIFVLYHRYLLEVYMVFSERRRETCFPSFVPSPLKLSKAPVHLITQTHLQSLELKAQLRDRLLDKGMYVLVLRFIPMHF